MEMKPNTIALILLVLATVFMSGLFIGSRTDPSLRIAALVSGTGLVSALAAIASTILTGKDLTKTGADLPPGSSVNTAQQTTIQVPADPKP